MRLMLLAFGGGEDDKTYWDRLLFFWTPKGRMLGLVALDMIFMFFLEGSMH